MDKLQFLVLIIIINVACRWLRFFGFVLIWCLISGYWPGLLLFFSVCTTHSLAIRSFLLVFAFVRNMLSSLTSEILAILLLFISELGGNGKLGYFG